MSEPFLAEIRIVGFNFAPPGWAFCDGQILPINQNQSLYSLLGTIYGGDGETSFALPELRGRVPVHKGTGFSLGQKGGEENHTLSAAEMPQHRHDLQATTAVGTEVSGVNNLLAKSPNAAYREATNLKNMRNGVLNNVGGGVAHPNMQPYLAVNYIIAISGLFPSEN